MRGSPASGEDWSSLGGEGEESWMTTYTFLDSSLEIAFRARGPFSTMANLPLLRVDLVFGNSQVSSEPGVVNQVGDQVG